MPPRNPWATLTAAEAAVEQARADVVAEIQRRLAMRHTTAYELAKDHRINRANLYVLLKGERWNAVVAEQALNALGVKTESA